SYIIGALMALIINKEFISCASKSTAHLAYCLTLHCSVFKEHCLLFKSAYQSNSFSQHLLMLT
ncbi:MAG: hypothetical protein ACOYD5_04715, partial [Negativicutes bacterium]